MKLQIGDIIEVIGSVKIPGLESGKKYKLIKITPLRRGDLYSFKKFRGKKHIYVSSYIEDFDSLIDIKSDNRIELIRRKNENTK